MSPDCLPLWFWLPVAIILWSAVLGLVLASVGPDSYPDEPTGLDVLERSGVHPHG